MSHSLHVVLPGLSLAMLLAIAVWHDVRARKIPNRLALFGILTGVTLNTILPTGAGFFIEPLGALGFTASLAGMGVGLATFLPLYAVGAMGAGDAKLMAMVGAFLGPKQILGAALLSLLAGGVIALAVAFWTGTLTRVLSNTRLLLLHALVRTVAGNGIHIDKPVTPTRNLAYAIAIMIGTIFNIILTRLSGWSVLS